MAAQGQQEDQPALENQGQPDNSPDLCANFWGNISQAMSALKDHRISHTATQFFIGDIDEASIIMNIVRKAGAHSLEGRGKVLANFALTCTSMYDIMAKYQDILSPFCHYKESFNLTLNLKEDKVTMIIQNPHKSPSLTCPTKTSTIPLNMIERNLMGLLLGAYPNHVKVNMFQEDTTEIYIKALTGLLAKVPSIEIGEVPSREIGIKIASLARKARNLVFTDRVLRVSDAYDYITASPNIKRISYERGHTPNMDELIVMLSSLPRYIDRIDISTCVITGEYIYRFLKEMSAKPHHSLVMHVREAQLTSQDLKKIKRRFPTKICSYYLFTLSGSNTILIRPNHDPILP